MNLLNKLKSMLGEPTEPENAVENTDTNNSSQKPCDCAEEQCDCSDNDKSECTCSDENCENCNKKDKNE